MRFMECWLYLGGTMLGIYLILITIVTCMLDGEIFSELCLQGEALFQTHENLEHLAMMERVLGPLPKNLLKRIECVII